MFTDIIYGIGDFFYWIFDILEKFENLPNIAFTLLGFAGLFYWLKTQAAYNKKSEETGGLR
ncbi:MAG: hypothetical protein Kow0079_10320 [Vicingaceae bacterium]